VLLQYQALNYDIKQIFTQFGRIRLSLEEAQTASLSHLREKRVPDCSLSLESLFLETLTSEYFYLSVLMKKCHGSQAVYRNESQRRRNSGLKLAISKPVKLPKGFHLVRDCVNYNHESKILFDEYIVVR